MDGDVELREPGAAGLGPVPPDVRWREVEVRPEVARRRGAMVVEDDGLDAGEDDIFSFWVFSF